MNDDFRRRVFTPIILPLGLAAAILLLAFSLSRVMLAVPETVATITALFVAGYILFVAAIVSNQSRISPRALGAGVALGLVGVLAAGAVSAAAGMRELHHAEEGHGEAGEGGEGEGEVAVPPDALVFSTGQLDFDEAPATATAGELTIALVNDSGLPHNVVFEGVMDDAPIAEDPGGGTDVGTVTLEPGTYTYYCSVPGHREGGMEGELVVS